MAQTKKSVKKASTKSPSTTKAKKKPAKASTKAKTVTKKAPARKTKKASAPKATKAKAKAKTPAKKVTKSVAKKTVKAAPKAKKTATVKTKAKAAPKKVKSDSSKSAPTSKKVTTPKVVTPAEAPVEKATPQPTPTSKAQMEPVMAKEAQVAKTSKSSPKEVYQKVGVPKVKSPMVNDDASTPELLKLLLMAFVIFFISTVVVSVVYPYFAPVNLDRELYDVVQAPLGCGHYGEKYDDGDVFMDGKSSLDECACSNGTVVCTEITNEDVIDYVIENKIITEYTTQLLYPTFEEYYSTIAVNTEDVDVTDAQLETLEEYIFKPIAYDYYVSIDSSIDSISLKSNIKEADGQTYMYDVSFVEKAFRSSRETTNAHIYSLEELTEQSQYWIPSICQTDKIIGIVGEDILDRECLDKIPSQQKEDLNLLQDALVVGPVQ